MEEHWQCQNCGNFVPEGLTVCPKCGLVKGGFDESTERQSRNSIYFVSGSGLFDRVVGRLGLSVDRTVGNRSWIFRIHSWDINSGKPVRRISVEYLLYARYDWGLVLFEVEKYMKNLNNDRR